jgi:hypothetical protein
MKIINEIITAGCLFEIYEIAMFLFIYSSTEDTKDILGFECNDIGFEECCRTEK